MLKFLITVIGLIVLIVFTIQNIEQVDVQLPFIQNAFRIRLIYLLLTTFIFGFISSYVWLSANHLKKSKKKRKDLQGQDLDEYL